MPRSALRGIRVLGGVALPITANGGLQVKYASGVDLLRQTPEFISEVRSKRLDGEFNSAYRYLEVLFDDIQEPVDGGTLPSRKHAIAILDAWQKCCAQGAKVVILHCEAGISRSTAAALGIHFLGTSNPVTGVAVAAQNLFAVNPFGHPNKLVLKLLLQTQYSPEQARVISAQLISAYSALQSIQENENKIRCD